MSNGCENYSFDISRISEFNEGSSLLFSAGIREINEIPDSFQGYAVINVLCNIRIIIGLIVSPEKI